MGNIFQSKADYMICETFSDALDTLLLQKDFDKISSTEIITVSGLSRTTFYKHFRDKYELATWKFRNLHEILPKIPTTVDEGDQNIAALVHFIAERKIIYKRLFQYNGQDSFENFYKAFADGFMQNIANETGRQISRHEFYVNRYHCMGAFAVLKEWVMSGDSISEEEILNVIISQSRTQSVRNLYLK